MVLVVVLVIRSRRLLRHDGPQQQIVAPIPPDADLFALDYLIRRQVHAVQKPAVECDPSRSLKFPFKSMLTKSVRTTLHFIQCARVLRFVVPLQFRAPIPPNSRIGFKTMRHRAKFTVNSALLYYFPIYISIFLDQAVDPPCVCSIKSQCAFHPCTHPSELNDSFKPWLNAGVINQDSDSGRIPEPHSISVSLCSQLYTTVRPRESTITGAERPAAGPRNNGGEVHLQWADAHRKVGFVSDAFEVLPRCVMDASPSSWIICTAARREIRDKIPLPQGGKVDRDSTRNDQEVLEFRTHAKLTGHIHKLICTCV
ncbi:hypothetical protein B0H14DRAFT_2609942 [Mycena olivaceomarginata]|nr:hypothetical protein B0H14DRAFT_2609942 [Mycena olivaceomarginata]